MGSKKDLVRDAQNFVFSYFGSPGYKERFNKFAANLLKDYVHKRTVYYTDYLNHKYRLEAKKRPIKVLYNNEHQNNASYKDGIVKIHPINFNSEFPAIDYANTAAHEFGHAIDDSVELIYSQLYADKNYYKGLKDRNPDIFEHYLKDGTIDNDGNPLWRRSELAAHYSDIFPHFRESKSYKKALNSLDEEHRDFFENHPMFWYEQFHDAMPMESYADLIELRYDLNATGIYDSRKANNPFTKEHLLKYKALKRKQRLFDNFTDDEIIKMMNEIAQNSIQTNNQPLYAKKGIKLIPKNKSRYKK